MLSKKDAQILLEKHISDPYHLLHAKMVALAMQEYAKRNNKNELVYYITGLLHDIDYIKGDTEPVNHGKDSAKLLKDLNYPSEIIYAIQAHVPHRTGIKPKNNLDFALIACDEISGLIYAYSLMRPNRFKNLKVKSLKKKFKDNNFAAKVDRELIKLGIEGLNCELSDHLQMLAEVFNQLD